MATSTATDRVHNFSSGPAVMVPVLEQIQHDLVSLPGVGMSILEVSHRSKVFEGVIAKAEADLRALASIPSNYKVLFLQGGASLQFSMVPMNLLPAGGSRRLHRHGIVDREGGEGSARRSAPSTSRRRRAAGQLHAASRRQSETDAHPRTPRTCTSRRTTRSRARSGSRCPTSATRRSSATPRPTSSAARSTSRQHGAHLRGRAEEPRPVRDDAGDHPRGLAGAARRRRCTRC